MSAADDDIVADFIERLRRLQPDFPQQIAAELEREIRADWAGQQVYIAARKARTAAAVAAVQAGAPVSVVVREHGIAKSTLYYLLKQRAER